MKRLVLILLSCIFIIIVPPATATLTPEQFLEPSGDMLFEDMSSDSYVNREMVKLSFSVYKVGTRIEALMGELEIQSENIKGYTEEKLAIAHLTRALDLMKLTLLSCFTQTIQLGFIKEEYFDNIYYSNIDLFEKHHLAVLNSSAITLIVNSKFLSDSKLSYKTIDIIVDVEDTFNAFIDYMNLLAK